MDYTGNVISYVYVKDSFSTRKFVDPLETNSSLIFNKRIDLMIENLKLVKNNINSL